LNGEAFSSLKKLKTVSLGTNTCINEQFDTEAEMATLPQKLKEKCWFVEPMKTSTIVMIAVSAILVSSIVGLTSIRTICCKSKSNQVTPSLQAQLASSIQR
jgi:hypothetical protein